MKSIISSMLILFALNSYAQVNYAYSLGVQSGITGATQRVEANGISESSKERVGFTIGGFANLKLSKYFSLQPELFYNSIGAKNNQNTKQDLVLDYLTMPVLVKFTYRKVGLYAGPQLGLLLNAKLKDDTGTTGVKENFKSTDMSLIFGADYTFNFGLIFSARLQNGFMNISEASGINSTKNKSAAIMIGYRIMQKR